MAYGKKKKREEKEEKIEEVKVVDFKGEVVATYNSKDNGKDYKEIAFAHARRIGGSLIE